MMRLPHFTFHAPRDGARGGGAARAGAPAGAMLVAGGTDLLPNMKRRQQVPSTLIGLAPHRRAASESPTAHRACTIGAGVTLTELVRDIRADHGPSRTRVRAVPGLWQAAAQVATPHLRNMGTLGGNLCLDTRCNYYDQNYEWRKAIDFCMKKDGEICWVATSSPKCLAVSSTDTAPALLALGAEVTLVSANGTRRIARLRSLPQRRHPLPDAAAERDPDAVHVPAARRAGAAPTGSCGGAARSTFRCCRSPPPRSSRADGTVEAARIVLGAVASRPIAAPAAGRGAHRPAADRRGRSPTPPKRAAQPAKPMDNTDFSLHLAQARDARLRDLRAARTARRRHARGAPPRRSSDVALDSSYLT